MKFRVNSRSVRVLVILSILMLAGCSGFRHNVCDMMIGFEKKRTGLTSAMIDVNGKPIAYLENNREASKPTVLLIHGFAANKENWIRFAGHLADNFNVVAVDLPGHGESVKRFDMTYSISDQVGYLHEITGALGIDRFHLAGNSMGGAISSIYAVRYPEQVQTLTLINSAGIFDHESELMKILAEGGKNPLIVETADDFDTLIKFALEKRPFVPWPLKSVFAEKAVANRALNKKIFAEMLNEADGSDFKAELAKIKAPTLIMWGDHDRIIHVDNAGEFAKAIPVSRLHIFTDVGHAPMIEIPAESARVFSEFILSNSDRWEVARVYVHENPVRFPVRMMRFLRQHIL